MRTGTAIVIFSMLVCNSWTTSQAFQNAGPAAATPAAATPAAATPAAATPAAATPAATADPAPADPAPADPAVGEQASGTAAGTATVVSEEPVDPNAAIMQEALQLFMQGDEAGAIAKADAYNQTQEVKIPSKVRIAVLALQLRNTTKARQLFHEVLKDEPTTPEPYIILADWNRGQGNLIEAQLLYEKGLSLVATQEDNSRTKNSKIQALTGLAQIANTLDDFVALRSDADQLLAIDAENVAGLISLSTCLFESGDLEGSLAKLEEVKKVAPEALISPKVTISRSFQNKDDLDSARKWMIDAIKEDPKNVQIRLAAADWALQTNQLKQAVDQLDVALKLDPKSVDAIHARGITAMVQKEYSKAEALFRQADELSAGNPILRNDLVLSLAMQDDSLKKQEAVSMAQTNGQAHPNQAEAVGTFGWTLSRLGQSESAEKALSQACMSGSRVSENTWYFFARVMVDRGKKAQALEILNLPIIKDSKFFVMKADADELRTTLEKDPTLQKSAVMVPAASATPAPVATPAAVPAASATPAPVATPAK
ncbi:MAG: tetratricopeptide repeat protein [Thermoguttaceae bacterium]|nr:tetratricopeptide repeat protein [Thermoguttaceae bacterium]